MSARNAPSPDKLRVIIGLLMRAVEGAAADKDFTQDLRFNAKGLPSAAVRDRRQRSKASMIGSEEVACLWDERERKDTVAIVRRQLGRKSRALQKLALRTKLKGKGIEVISQEKELEEFHPSE